MVIRNNEFIVVKNYINSGQEVKLNLGEFIEYYVGTKNTIESNMFLNSLWREFNESIAPVGLLKCPWAYLPQKIAFKKGSLIYFGSMRTIRGYIHVAITYKIKGEINNILFYIDGKNDKQMKELKGLVKIAKRNINLKFK